MDSQGMPYKNCVRYIVFIPDAQRDSVHYYCKMKWLTHGYLQAVRVQFQLSSLFYYHQPHTVLSLNAYMIVLMQFRFTILSYNRSMKTVITGIQPTNMLHIGNLFGAIQQLQYIENATKILFVPDLHAFTTQTSISKQSIYNILRYYIALCPNAHYYIQSQHNYVCKLAWILMCNTSMGTLERMTQYKDKTAMGVISNCGLLAYPVLMAADILAVSADNVLVGKDQLQHLELARDISIRFNKKYNTDLFVIPQPILLAQKLIFDLQHPNKKMSKSAVGTLGTIFVTDDLAAIQKKIGKAVTDAMPMPLTVEELNSRNALANLLNIYSLCAGISLEQAVNTFAGQAIIQFKNKLVEVLNIYLLNVREKTNAITDTHITAHLQQSANYIQSLVKKQESKLETLLVVDDI
jgi:tryptophanyl-tRNA synthetase